MLSTRTKNNLLLTAQIFLLFAFLARAVLPQGFMPGVARDGALFPLVICSSEGVKTVFVDAEHIPDMPQQGKHVPHQASDAPCAFSAVFGTGVLPVIGAVVQLSWSAVSYAVSGWPQFIAAKVSSSYLSRAPPVLI